MTPDVTWHVLTTEPPASALEELDHTGAVALVAAGDRGWAALAALGLARALARSGRRVFLVDAELGAPRLHSMADIALGEGVSDLILYGASPAHVARELEARLLFVSAGTPVVDHGSVFESGRWEAFIEAATEARACILMLVPPLAEAAPLLARADSVVWLGQRDAVPDLGEAAPPARVGFEPGPEPSAPEAAPEPHAATLEPAPSASSASGDGAVAPTPEWAIEREDEPKRRPAAKRDDEPLSLATAKAMNRAARKTPERKSRAGFWFTLLLVLVVALLAAAWWGLIDLPGIAPRRADARQGVADPAGRQAAAAPLTANVPPPAEASPSSPSAAPIDILTDDIVAPVQSWSLRIGAFRDRAVARREANALQERVAGQVLTVAPVEVNGVRWYRVLSVLARDAQEAEALRSGLADATAAPDAASWMVREAPLSFLVTETGVLDEARRRVEALASAGVDAFVLSAARSEGAPVLRVYAGAYANPQEAAVMRALLEGQGIVQPPLVERRGIRPE